MRWIGVLIAGVIAGWSSEADADVGCRYLSKTSCDIEVHSEIKSGDFDKFVELFNKSVFVLNGGTSLDMSGFTLLDTSGLTATGIINDRFQIPKESQVTVSRATVLLNSTGGNVYEAMKIGRFLRKNEMKAIVSIDNNCISACVFLLMGSVNRHVITIKDRTNVGIHRPYFAEMPIGGPENIEIAYKKLREDVITYAKEMNIDTSLINLMYSINPNDVKYLTKSDLSNFLLNKKDPIFEERKILEDAAFLGVSTIEYRKRMIARETACSVAPDDSWLNCRNAHRLGLSVSEYLRRNEIYSKEAPEAWAGGEDRARACFQSIMVHNKPSC